MKIVSFYENSKHIRNSYNFKRLCDIVYARMFVKWFNKYADNKTRSRVISEMHQEDLNTMMKSDNTYLFIGIHKILFQIN